MKKIMMLGKIGCGKTTLSQRLTGQETSYKKTQAIEVVGDDILDTPGEYVEQKQFYGALTVTAADADVIVLLIAANDEVNMFSPRMNSMFAEKPMIGVITKTDLCHDPERIAACRQILEMAGALTCIQVGLDNEACVEKLKGLIEEAS